MSPGENLLTGAPKTCPTCKKEVELEVCRSGAGYYIGSYCNCGPYTRESEYYGSYPEAEKDLGLFSEALNNGASPPPTARSSGYRPGTMSMRGLGEIEVEKMDGSKVRLPRSAFKEED